MKCGKTTAKPLASFACEGGGPPQRWGERFLLLCRRICASRPILLPLALTLRFSFPNYVRPHEKTVIYFKYVYSVTY